eukprot:384154_1
MTSPVITLSTLLLLMVCIKLIKTELSPPNVLFFLVDDMGWTDISVHNSEYQTPNIDGLYSSGIELTNYYVHMDCSPTRSSVLTGKYAWKTGLQNIATVPPASTQHIPLDTPTIAELMKSAGYNTHGLGKWHLGYASWNYTPISRGFDTYFGMFQGEQFYYNHTMEGPPVPGEDYVFGGFDFWDNKNIYYDAIGKYSNLLYTERLINILNEYNASQTKPFFVYMAFQTIHEPIEPPPNTYETCDGITNPMRKIYCDKMVYLDESIGRIVDTLKKNGLYNNTLIALSTDNGGMPYWVNKNTKMIPLSWGCNIPYRAGKITLFEGGVKGIGLLSGALVDKSGLSGTTNDILTHCSDWLPTFVEGIAGKELPKNIDFDGMNIMNGLGKNATKWNRTQLYVNIDTMDFNGTSPGTFDAIIYNESDINTVWKYINGVQPYTNYYYCNQTAFGPSNLTETEWLFNMSDNPYEFEEKNLVNQYPQKVKQLKAMIQYQIDSGAFVPDQDREMYIQAFPPFHNGVWTPWLD